MGDLDGGIFGGDFLVTTGDLPVEVILAPGAEADVAAFKSLPLDLSPGSRIFADVGYLDDEE